MGPTRSTGRHARAFHRVAALALLGAATLGVQAQGLSLRQQDSGYSQRTSVEYSLTNIRLQSNSIRSLGDYYFYDPAQGSLSPALGSVVGGFRASTGIVGLSQPQSLYDMRPDPLQNVPYIGLGYSHLYFKSQLSLNADFGLASQNHGHGLFTSASSLDDVANQLRWAPVMAVKLGYSF